MLFAQAGKSKTQPSIGNEMQYVEAVLHGNERILRMIYDRYLPPVISFITQSGGRRADALDVFQDALVIIYEKAKNPDFQLSGTFFSYLYGVCRRVYGNRLQKKDNQTVTFEPGIKLFNDIGEIEPLLEQEEKEKLFWEAFKKLGKDCQLLMQLFFEGHSMEEIGQVLGHGSVGYTKKRKFYCKEALVEHVKADPRYAEMSA